MKKFLLPLLSTLLSVTAFSQSETDTLLVELSQAPCECISSIKTANKKPTEVSDEISKCIDKAVGPYQMGASLKNALKDSGTIDANGKRNVSIGISFDKNSATYKKYYYIIERYLMENCDALKAKITQQNLRSDRSYSSDEAAMKDYNRGQDASQKEDYDKAIKFYRKALARDSIFAFAWDNLGLCLRKLGRYDEALVAYQKSLDIDSNGVMPLQNMAVVYNYKKQYEDAIKVYERLTAKDSTNPESYYGIGQIAAGQLHDYEKGLDNMCKAYNLYTRQKSPYRTDAEKMIQAIYSEMKNAGKEERFFEILKRTTSVLEKAINNLSRQRNNFLNNHNLPL